MSRGRPLTVNILLAGTELFGGVVVALHMANLLHRRGHEVRVLSPEDRPDWYRLEAAFVKLDRLSPEIIPPAQVTVATYWTTIEPAYAAGNAEVVHYCQGFEGEYLHNVEDHAAILAAYAKPVPAWAVSPHLAELVRNRFGRPVRLLRPGLRPGWRPRRWGAPRSVPRILVEQPYENYWKGVRTALQAVVELRRRGVSLQLIRLSQWPLGDAERTIVEPDEFHEHLLPNDVPRLMRSCDLLLAPSWQQEGFGLPVLEAMASGVPVVATDIPAFRGFAADAATLVPPRDPQALADAAQAVLGDRQRWRRMRRAGLEVARHFSEQVTADAAEEALFWVAEGRWRSEP